MRNSILCLLLACGWHAHAAGEPAPAATATAPSTLADGEQTAPPDAAGAPPAAAEGSATSASVFPTNFTGAAATATPEIVPVIALDADFPLIEAATNLAQQAGIVFEIAPEVATNTMMMAQLRRPVGPVRFQNVSYRKALETILAQNQFALGHRDGVSSPLLGSRDSRLTPLEPEGGDLAKLAPEEEAEIQAFFDPNKEVPLITAIQMLGRLAKLNLLIDPRLKTGGVRQVGTNIVELPPVATNTVSLSTYGGVTPRQTLEAVLNNYGLALISDRTTGFSQVTYKDPAAKEPVHTFVVPLRFSNTTNIATLVQTTFPATKIQSDVRTAQLVVLATQKDYDSITNLIASLDLPTKQVLIEARFLETFTNPKTMKGIDWTDTLQAQRFTMGNGLLSGGSSSSTTTRTPGDAVTTTLPSGRTVTTTPASTTTTTRSETRNTSLDSTIVSLSSAGGFSPNVAFLNAQGVNAVLSLLNTESDTRTVATPRAVTLDNQETRLEVTRAIPIFDASEAIGTSGATVSSSKPNYTNVGTILIVTPRIAGTNVSMRLRPEISRVEAIPSRKVVAGKVNEADIFATSRIETQVLIPSGNTLVMGGLISDTMQNGFTKVPVLGDIPVLGWAFRRESKERSKANLIIFVTPTIIESDNFQPTQTDFLSTPRPEQDMVLPGAIDRGQPWKMKKGKKDPSAS